MKTSSRNIGSSRDAWNGGVNIIRNSKTTLPEWHIAQFHSNFNGQEDYIYEV